MHCIYRVYLKGVAKAWGWFIHTTSMKKVHTNMGAKNPPFRVRALFCLWHGNTRVSQMKTVIFF
jgi:hypothetical protein